MARRMIQKPCKYCCPDGKEIAHRWYRGNVAVQESFAYIADEEILIAGSWDIHNSTAYTASKKIKFCPMCGRELKKKE